MSVFQSWTVENQQIVCGIAKDAVTEITRQVRKSVACNNAHKQHGIEVYTTTAAEIVECQTVINQPYDKYKTSINPGLITKFERVDAQSDKA